MTRYMKYSGDLFQGRKKKTEDCEVSHIEEADDTIRSSREEVNLGCH